MLIYIFLNIYIYMNLQGIYNLVLITYLVLILSYEKFILLYTLELGVDAYVTLIMSL